MTEEPNTGRVTQVVQTSPATKLRPGTARLHVPEGPDKGKGVTVRDGPVIVGADSRCGLVLVDRTVSRRHAELLCRGDLVVVRDLASTNGTFYRDVQVGEVFVPLGGEITFGKTRVKILPEEVAVETKPHEKERLGPLIGGDLRMREIFTLIEDLAESDVTVVIEGETGTGKELVAQAIHEHSLRKDQNFVVFDCTNQPKDLVESALFGHVKGAFTGATNPRLGAFERGHLGTIFLDELGELGLDLQPKLLRVLESKEIQKVGGDGYQSVDSRVIAATNRNLRAEVRGGRFREDLYYRLAVVKINLPSLRERASDIPRLVTHFVNIGGGDLDIDPLCYPELESYDWPGNVRELKNVVDRALALCKGKTKVDLARFIQEQDLDRRRESSQAAPISEELSFKEAKGRVISDFESRYIETLLRQHGNNISVAARSAGIDRKHFKELMRKHGIEARPAKPD